MRADDLREDAIQQAVVSILDEDALDDEPDLVFALDELLAYENDRDAIEELQRAAARANYADDAIDRRRREVEGRDWGERTEAEQAVDEAERQTRQALNAYVEDRVEARLDDAVEWLGGDVTLGDLSGEGGESR